ncbi:MAG: hypothetical protein WBW48_21140 [Anaerolineae bacterium]
MEKQTISLYINGSPYQSDIFYFLMRDGEEERFVGVAEEGVNVELSMKRDNCSAWRS